MAAALALRDDFTAARMRALARSSRDANQAVGYLVLPRERRSLTAILVRCRGAAFYQFTLRLSRARQLGTTLTAISIYGRPSAVSAYCPVYPTRPQNARNRFADLALQHRPPRDKRELTRFLDQGEAAAGKI